ncbi:MAG: N-acetylmuramoyl-L-alanine amidase [Hyphomicrobiaceae bacterium]
MASPSVFVPASRLVDAVHASPNFEPRRGVTQANMLLLHYTGMHSAAKAIDWLSRPESRVSSHYVLDEHGVVTQLVAETDRAWHAGLAVWHGETDINSLSIGIEIHNPGHDHGYPDFPEVQMCRLEALCQEIVTRWSIPPERVLAHSDVAPKRKIDPGEKFDWKRLSQRGVGHWVEPEPVDPVDLGCAPESVSPVIAAAQQKLARYGYGVPQTGILDADTRIVVAAFQRHFRPARVDGRLDRSTCVTLDRLLAAVPQYGA